MIWSEEYFSSSERDTEYLRMAGQTTEGHFQLDIDTFTEWGWMEDEKGADYYYKKRKGNKKK